MEQLSIGQLLVRLQVLRRSRSTGQFNVRSSNGQHWQLHFHQGYLVWANGGNHRFRRWYRCLKLYCPALDPQGIQFREGTRQDHWEAQALSILVSRQRVSREQANAIIMQMVAEVLFDLLQDFEQHHTHTGEMSTQAAIGSPLVQIDIEPALKLAKESWHSWMGAGLVSISPDFAPILKQPQALERQLPAETYTNLRNLLNGNQSLRDLAIEMKQNLLLITRSFMPYFQQGVIGLQAIADLPEPSYQVAELQVPVFTNQPLIVCIDDSLDVHQSMSEILTQAGYRFIALQDSCQALPALLAQKPQLIFLDLVMPIASGYEVCAQIRRVTAFKQIPIVILTGNDGIVDRVRAKLAGATDFLAKPVDATKVLGTVRRCLGANTTPLPNLPAPRPTQPTPAAPVFAADWMTDSGPLSGPLLEPLAEPRSQSRSAAGLPPSSAQR